VQCVVSNDTNIIPTVDCVKKASTAIKISSLEHYNSYNKLIPFLEEYSRLNPGFKYRIEKHNTDYNFERVAILFNYSNEAIKYCYKAFGVDAAFTDEIGINGLHKKELQSFIEGIPDCDVMFKRCFISGVSGRTMNNEMILFALCIGYSECIADYSFLFQFMTDNNVSYFIIIILLYYFYLVQS